LAGGTGTYAFLVGIAWWESGGLAIEQFFMRNHSEEASLLLALSQRLAERSVMATFNGKSFDWPLLQTRYRITRTPVPANPFLHVDLMHAARRLWRLRVRSVALTELERHVLGLDRGGDINSGSIPARYFQFLRGNAGEPLAEVFRHNELDLRGLAFLTLKVLSLLDDPYGASRDGGEMYGISKMLQRRGQEKGAAHAFERALQFGLPERESRRARRELARIARRSGDFDRAKQLWEQLCGSGPEGLEAYEQLAIHYERRAHAPLRALEISREALVRATEDFRSGHLAAASYRQWHARFARRMDRLKALESRAGRQGG
jgi:tetratricopeptide (TPR) repeat protein